jgi:HD-like signal output (HDOD) protein
MNKTTCEYAIKNKVPLLDAERAVLGIDHAQIGRILADKWALPLDLEYSLVFHHAPFGADKLTDLVSTVHIADIITHKAGLDLWEGEAHVQEWADTRKVLRISDNDLKKIMETLEESIEKSLEFFNIIK